MAKISYMNIPEEWKPLVDKVLSWNNRFTSVSVRSKKGFISVKKKKGLTLKSLTPLASTVWASLSPTDKDLWKSAGLNTQQTSFQCFLRDISARVKNELSYPITPSNYVQYNCGRAVFEFPATGFLIKQEHPFSYFVARKVRGTRNQIEPVEIKEDFDLPFTVGISYQTDLSSVGPNSKACFYVDIVSHYQGRDIITTHTIDFGLNTNWTKSSLVISSVLGKPKSYTVYIEVSDCVGYIEWDNIILNHSGVNWARDPKCDNVGTSYTGSFYLIAKNWEPVVLPPGSAYGSIYYDI